VFVVGYLGDWRRAAAVLFERESLQGHPAPCREAGQKVAAFTPSIIGGYREGIGTLRANGGDLGGGSECLITKWPADVAPTLNAHFGDKQGLEDQHALNGAGLFTLAFSAKDHGADAGPISPTLRAGGFDKSHANGGVMPAVALQGSVVRRLTVEECESLQGFPRKYTLIPYRGRLAADGPRYKSLGNSFAVPVVRWIGERIDMVERLTKET
jgi:DNA (cytosine-5)-methyltransferase 1